MIEPTHDMPDHGDEPRDRRRYPRVSPLGVGCLLGEVVDLSLGGLQLHRFGSACYEVGDTFDLVLRSDGPSLPLAVRVAWIEELDRRERVYGLRFVGLSRQAEAQLAQLVESLPFQATAQQAWLAA